MRLLDSVSSIRKARIASLALRAMLSSLPSSMFLATCWVMVLAPIGRRPWPYCCTSNQAARAIASGSMPLWDQNFWSSADTKACFTSGGMAVNGTKMRRSVASSEIRRESPA